MKNKIISFDKWLSIGQLDSHLPKSLTLRGEKTIEATPTKQDPGTSCTCIHPFNKGIPPGMYTMDRMQGVKQVGRDMRLRLNKDHSGL